LRRATAHRRRVEPQPLIHRQVAQLDLPAARPADAQSFDRSPVAGTEVHRSRAVREVRRAGVDHPQLPVLAGRQLHADADRGGGQIDLQPTAVPPGEVLVYLGQIV